MKNRCSQDLINTALLLFAALSVAAQAASPRVSPLPPAAEFVATPAADVWLARLPGRFRFDGILHREQTIYGENGPPRHIDLGSQPAAGQADCMAFSEGAGLRCVLDVIYPQQGQARLGETVTPAMILAGLAPSAGAIRFLLVDSRGLAHPGQGKLSGDAAILEQPCVNRPGMESCKLTIRVEAAAEARILRAQVTDRSQFVRVVRTGGVRTELQTVEEITELQLALRPDERTEKK